MIAPSILSANFLELKKDIELINNSNADYIHLDVMDGVFVPNITFGVPIIKQIKTIAQKPLDTHLMIIQPERYIEEFADAGSKVITVHYEACIHLHRTIQQIKKTGALAGVSINPHTPVSVLENILCELDLVLIMSVNPGFGGQTFIPFSFDKIRQLKEIKEKNKYSFLIEVDGGVTLENAAELYKAGVDILVAGNTVFSNPDPLKTINEIREKMF
ncbi:MAG: ribulose-phosphate 3-epimerase [Bacteroidales bacterium]|nr:ribulose-phosphate 3-epimerase [Bacteroidales bacterium]